MLPAQKLSGISEHSYMRGFYADRGITLSLPVIKGCYVYAVLYGFSGQCQFMAKSVETHEDGIA